MNEIKSAIPNLLSWFQEYRRPLSFRTNPTPYTIWVSEIMLQQTRIEAVIPHFESFMKELPTIEDLAQVDDAKLMKLWEGLGYYSRARNLKKAAIQIVEQYDGQLPKDYSLLRKLPGIGDYTAGAIASIAYHLPVPAVDGNVLRVFARLTTYPNDILLPNSKKELTAVVREVLPKNAPDLFNEAVMELGETICIPGTNPHCDLCPLQSSCKAFATDTVSSLPVRVPKTKKKTEQRTVFLITDGRHILLHKRPSSGLLADMWEFPNVLDGNGFDEYIPQPSLVVKQKTLTNEKHIFSHIVWQMTGLQISTLSFPAPDNCVWATKEELEAQYALPSAFRAYTAQIPALIRK